MLPSLKILLGTAGDGLSEAMLTLFHQKQNQALMILPSLEQVHTVANQSSVLTNMPVAENKDRFTTFSVLVKSINDQERNNTRTISRALRRLALIDIMPQKIKSGDFFGKMLDAPGFIPALADSIKEWKSAGLTPELLKSSAFDAAARLENPAYAKKALELGSLFEAYELFLIENHYRDEEDCIWAATELISSDKAKLPDSVSNVFVDGFYRFTRAQRSLLAAIANQGRSYGKLRNELIVSLPHSSRRQLLFAAPDHTLQLLRGEFETQETVLPQVNEVSHSALSVLSNRLFSHEEARHPEIIITDSEKLKIFDAPNPYVESEMVAREFRRLHDENDFAWKDMTILLRTMGEYAPILSAVFERYKVPIDIDGPEVMDQNPVIKTILSFFAVVRRRWQRDDVLDFLKSSYTIPDKLQVDNLKKRARKDAIREGKDAFISLVSLEPESSLNMAIKEMSRVDALLTAHPMEMKQFEEHVRAIFEVFGINYHISQGEHSRQERDRAAIHTAYEVLEAMTEISRISRRGPVSCATYMDELSHAWRGKAAVASSLSDQVRVAEPYDSRKHPVRIAAVMGLTERGFPRRISEDPFLRDEEREILHEVTGIELEELKSRSDDERFFFYLSVTAPSDRLILSFPRSADESDALPSFYLDEVRSIFESENNSPLSRTPIVVSRTLADVAPRYEECATEEDRLLSGCADLFDPGMESDFKIRNEKQQSARNLLSQLLQREGIEHKTREVLQSRGLPHLPRLLIPENSKKFSQRRYFTVTELETYRLCPFKYMISKRLNLRPVQDGAGRQIQGTILHTVLREYFSRTKSASSDASAASLTDSERLVKLQYELGQLLMERLKNFPLDASQHRIQMAQRLLSDALNRFAERELQFQSRFGMTPSYFELGFGKVPPEDNSDEEMDSKYRDTASVLDDLAFTNEDGTFTINVCGKIDRVDISENTDRALVIDYKLGQSPEYKAMQNGISLQMPLYMMALERIFNLKPIVGCYDTTEEKGRPRIFRLELGAPKQFGVMAGVDKSTSVTPLNRDQYADLIKTAEAASLRIATDIASARVAATPGNHCRFCDFSDICRTTAIDGHDGEPLIPITTKVQSH